MGWGSWVLVVLLALGLGAVGGLVAARGVRRRGGDVGRGARTARAAFRLDHGEGQTWVLGNVGTATALLVSVVPLVDGLEHWPPRASVRHLESATSELLPTLAPGASVSLWLSRWEPGQQVLVSWTAEDDVRMGPVALDLPVPR